MDQKINFQETIFAVAQDMAKANAELQASIPEKPDYSLVGLIRTEIARGKVAAAAWKRMCLGSTTYTHTDLFPLEVYDNLTEEMLLQLEFSDIYIYKNKEANTAVIKIVFHF